MNNVKKSLLGMLAAVMMSSTMASPDPATHAPWANYDQKVWSQHDWEVMQRALRVSRSDLPSLQSLADEGDVVAQTVLGLAYRDGMDRSVIVTARGAESTIRSNPDNAQALKYLEAAAKSGYPVAQLELARMYYQGHGVARDVEQAKTLSKLAAEHAFPRARAASRQIDFMAQPDAQTMGALVATIMGESEKMFRPNEVSPNGVGPTKGVER